MKKYLAECIGTFFLVFCGTGAIIINQESGGVVSHVGVAITFGLVVMAMIYAVGDVSGAHLNPAVTIGFLISEIFPIKEVLPYLFSQTIGAFTASLTLKALFSHHQYLGSTMPSGSETQSFILETILTFMLIFTILSLSNSSKEKNSLGGIIIGSVVLLEALFAGPISGASMNPIRSISPAVVSGHLEHLWLYIVAPLLGMLVAVLIWKLIFKTEIKN